MQSQIPSDLHTSVIPWEAVQIANTFPTQLINSRSEYIRPVIRRLTHTDLIADDARDRGPGHN